MHPWFTVSNSGDSLARLLATFVDEEIINFISEKKMCSADHQIATGETYLCI